MKLLIASSLASATIFISAFCFFDIFETANTVSPTALASVTDTPDDADGSDGSADTTDASYISLDDGSITIRGRGAVVNGKTVTIISGGTYITSGTLDNGRIVVDVKDKEKVKLVLDGVDITCFDSAPVYIVNAEKVELYLAEGTNNRITDTDSYLLDNETANEPNAAVFSNDDLIIKGNGQLVVTANFNNGIQSRDDLNIRGGDITVTALNHGIKGKDSVSISQGTVIVKAGGDGIQSDNETNSDKGRITIEGGIIDITSEGDGLHAETDLYISGGDITIRSGGGSGNGSNNSARRGWGRRDPRMDYYAGSGVDSVSTKGIKAGADLTIDGGTIHVDSSDDSLHSDDTLTINGGNIVLASGDDAIRSTSAIEINGGDIDITTSYEGIECATITLNDGNISLLSNDDGINVVSATKGMYGGRRGRGGFGDYGNNRLIVNGGHITVDAYGDGLDINGTTSMTGGVLIVNGPSDNMNSALDCDGGFQISGGLLVAVGSSGMAQAPGSSSTQYSAMVNLPSRQPGGSILHIESKTDGETITVVPTKAYQSIVFSSPEIKKGSEYSIYLRDTVDGSVSDNLPAGKGYSAGDQIAILTITDITTYAGSSSRGFSRRGRR